MEEVMRLRMACGEIRLTTGQIAKSLLLAVLLCCLYLSGLRQENTGVPGNSAASASGTGRKSVSRDAGTGIASRILPHGISCIPSISGTAIAVTAVTDVAVSKPLLPDVSGITRLEPEIAEPGNVDSGTAKPDVAEPAEPDAAGPGVEVVEPAGLRVIIHGCGEVTEKMTDAGSFDIADIETPVRPGKIFSGWFTDAECTEPYAGIAEDAVIVELYAGFSEFPGFVSDDSGYITGYTKDAGMNGSGILMLPSYENCLGVRTSAFEGLEEAVEEIFIPANIIEIPESELIRFSNLWYIEVEEGNPSYYSEFGVLYRSDGTLVYDPNAKWG